MALPYGSAVRDVSDILHRWQTDPAYREAVARACDAAREWEAAAPERQAALLRTAKAREAWDTLDESERRRYRRDSRIWDDPDGAAGVALRDAGGEA